MTATAQASKFTLRRAVFADLGAVEAMLVESKLPTAGVADCIDDFIVAESAGRLVGAIGVETHGQYGLLRSAAVAKDWQGQGVGRSLVAGLLDLAAQRELLSLYLLTTTAEGYFPVFGFSRVDRDSVPDELMESEEFRGACPESAVVMRKALHD